MPRFIVTGTFGTGKSALIAALSADVATVSEPARELIAEHRLATGEESLDGRPRVFVSRLIERSLEKYQSVEEAQVVVFDRGLPDCIAYAQILGCDSEPASAVASMHRYAPTVFYLPPWKEIYHTDDMRRATFVQSEMFDAEVRRTYESLGYELVTVPKAPIDERAVLVRAVIGG